MLKMEDNIKITADDIKRAIIDVASKYTEVKQVILVRSDLEMSMGKCSIQIHHAAIKSARKADKEIVKKWHRDCIKTIILEVPDDYELVDLYYRLDESGLPFFLAIDLGVTEFGKPTITALGIGPAISEDIDKYTSQYKLYKPNEEFLEENYNIDGEQTQDVMEYVKEKRSKEDDGENSDW